MEVPLLVTMLPQASESTHGPVHSMMYSRHCCPAGRFVQVMDMVERSILVVEQSDGVELILTAVAGAAGTSPNVHSAAAAARTPQTHYARPSGDPDQQPAE